MFMVVRTSACRKSSCCTLRLSIATSGRSFDSGQDKHKLWKHTEQIPFVCQFNRENLGIGKRPIAVIQ